MRITPCLAPPLVFTAALLALATFAHARPVTPETITGMAKKADVLIVGEVLKIEDISEEQSDTWKMPILHKRATIRVLRGINAASAATSDLSLAVVDYIAAKGNIPPDGPMFPNLQTGQVAVFPLKLTPEKTWRFVSEEDAGMFAPALAREINSGWPATIPGPVAFYYRELAGACLYGDFSTMARAAAYLNTVAGADQPADPIFGLFRAEIGESNLREDTRWVAIGTAAYIASGTPRPTLDALINGMVADGGGAGAAPRAPTDVLPAVPSLRLATLCLRKSAKFQLGERILMLLIARQEEFSNTWGIAKALVDNFEGSPMMISMEQQTIRTGKPGALYIADYMVKDRYHPLAASAVEGARKVLARDGDARDIPKEAPYTTLHRQAQGLLLRAGTNEDFTFLLDIITETRPNPDKPPSARDEKLYQAIMLLAGDSEFSPPARVLQICRQYIDDPAALPTPPWPGFRLCDLAALTAARVGRQDFGLKPDDPVDQRDVAVAKAREWLKARP